LTNKSVENIEEKAKAYVKSLLIATPLKLNQI
jgi:hypothetical protein